MEIHKNLRQINPPPRLMMGPGPVNADPRVQRAMSADLLGQYDPAMTDYMNEVMELYRQIFVTKNHWTFLIDGTSRSAIEAALVSMVEKGDKVLVPVFGRFGHLLTEISERVGATVIPIHKDWGEIFSEEEIADALDQHKPSILAICQGDTSTTMNQPLDYVGRLCRERGVISYVDATASLVGNPLPVDEYQIDICTVGLQKCLGGPSGSAPVTMTDEVADRIKRRWHVEKGIEPEGFKPGAGSRIKSNYFDLAMIMAYWSPERLNHHTEATSMLYAAHECARIVLQCGLEESLDRHALASEAMVAGLQDMDLQIFGDMEHKMPNITGVYIPDGVNGDRVRSDLLNDFGIEIGTSFGPMHGKIWRIGTMGYNCRKRNVLICLTALEATLRQNGMTPPEGAGVEAAIAVYRTAGQ